MFSELEDEIEVTKNTLAKSSTELNNKRVENKALQQELQKKIAKAELLTTQLANLNESVARDKQLLGSLETEAISIDDMLKQTENKYKLLERQLADFKDQQYKQSQQLFTARKEETNFVASISGANAQNKNMQSKIQQMDTESFKQQELLYNIEFQVQQMERKVSRASGERTEEEMQQLNAKIEDLQTELDQTEGTLKMVTSEHKRVLGEVKLLRQRIMDKDKEKARLEEKVVELTLEVESHEHEMKELSKKKEDVLVQHDVLKLNINRLRQLLRGRADEVSGLENRKFQLEITLLEKESQVKAHLDILAAEFKNIDESRRKLALEMNERRMQIEKLKNKFDILSQSLAPIEGHEGEPVTQAHYIIKVVQEREELQRKGDLLDQQIRDMERQDESLRKTLDLFKTRNMLHMGTFRKIDDNDENYQKKLALEQKIKDLDSVMSRRIQERNEYAESANMKKSEVGAAQNSKKDVEIKTKAQMDTKKVLEADIKDAKSKLETQTKLAKSAMKEALKQKDKNSPEMKYIEVQDTKMKTNITLSLLSTFCQSDNDLHSAMMRILAQKGVKLPDNDQNSVPSTPSTGRLSVNNNNQQPLNSTRSSIHSARSVGSNKSSARNSVGKVSVQSLSFK